MHIWCFMVGILFMLIVDEIFRPRHITLEKSSDSEWVVSKENYPDTVITRVWVNKHDGKIDTLYPTTIYKRIKLN